MLQVRRRLNHGLCLVVCLALALAGCTNYRVSLDPVTLDDPAAGAAAPEAAEAGASGDEPAALRVPPQPLFLQQELEDPPVAGKPEGWVRLRFAVDARGGVQKVEVLESSELAFEAPAVRLISSWSYTPGTVGGEPAAFEGQEAYVTFFEEAGVVDTAEENLLIGGIIVVTLATVIILAFTTGVDFTAGD